MFEKYRDIVTVAELQAMLGIGRNMAYDLLQSGAIYSKRCGKRYIIPKSAVVAYLGGADCLQKCYNKSINREDTCSIKEVVRK